MNTEALGVALAEMGAVLFGWIVARWFYKDRNQSKKEVKK